MYWYATLKPITPNSTTVHVNTTGTNIGSSFKCVTINMLSHAVGARAACPRPARSVNGRRMASLRASTRTRGYR